MMRRQISLKGELFARLESEAARRKIPKWELLDEVVAAVIGDGKIKGDYRLFKCPSCDSVRRITGHNLAVSPRPICYECEMSSPLEEISPD